MKNILAIARLTISEGVRMRIVLVFVVVLLFIMLRLPFSLHGDETVSGRLQTFLSYSFSAVSVLLGISAVFLACATLTQDIKNHTIYLVLAKPVSRFQILAGKWLGVNMLMGLLVILATLTIYGFAVFIKSRPTEFARDELQLRDVVWRARIAAEPTPPEELHKAAEDWVVSEMKQGTTFARGPAFAVAERYKEELGAWRTIPPGTANIYFFDNLIAPREEETAIQIRYRLRGQPLNLDMNVPVSFAFVDPDEPQVGLSEWHPVSGRSMMRHQFLVRGKRVIKDGRCALVLKNDTLPPGKLIVHIEDEDGLQILYNVGSFEENYAKAVLLIVAQIAFLSALGLFLGAWVSFPVACMGVFTLYLISMAMPFVLESIGANLEYRTVDVDPYGHFGPAIRAVLVPFLKVALPNFWEYDGARRLIGGEYISYDVMGRALAHTILYGGVLLLLPGWLIFRSREVAGVQV